MIYNKSELESTFLKQEIDDLCDIGFLKKERKIIASKKLESLNTNSKWWIRLLNIFLGTMGLFFAYAFFDLTLFSRIEDNFPFLLFFQGIITYIVLEFLVKQMKYFNHGISDAFLLVSFGQIAFFIWHQISSQNTITEMIIFMVISGLLAYRFVNVFMAIILFVSVNYLQFLVMLEMGEIGKSILPFTTMLLSGFIWFLINKIKADKNYFFYYEACVNCFEILNYVVLYLAGNYLIVRVASETLLDKKIEIGNDIPLAWFFNAYTIIIPIAYIYWGIKNKTKIILYVGLFAIVFAAYTIRTYHHVLPTEVALVVSGLFLFILAYFAIAKLKGKTTGVTFEQDKFESDYSYEEIETIATASDFGVEVNVESDNFDFGGGKFGGGGAGGAY